MSYTDLTYFTCPLPEKISRLIMAGKFPEAKKQITIYKKKKNLPELLQKRLSLEERILEEYERSYTLSREELFAKLCEEVNDFSEEEFEQLKSDGTLDYIYIGGKERYIENACENATKTVSSLSERRKNQVMVLEDRQRISDLNRMIQRMKKEGSVSVRYQVRQTLTVHPDRAEEGGLLQAYVPIPLRDKQCYPENITAYCHNNKKEVKIYVAPPDAGQRTVYFECPYEKDTEYVVEFSYEIHAGYVQPDADVVAAAAQPSYEFDTEEILPQIAFTPYMKALAMELKGEETNPLLIARRFYDFVTTVATYRYVPAYITKTNIPEYFSAGLHGDCGMHALTFITLCRIAGIPARWQAGWYTRPYTIGNHDWACFYIEPYGWLFADGSFGGSAYRMGDLERWNFYFGNLDPFRMVANSDLQVEFDPPFPDLRLDPYDNQAGEAALLGHTLKENEFSLNREMIDVTFL